MVVWTEERWRSHTPPRLERRRAAHRRRRGRGHKPGCWALHTPRRLERRARGRSPASREGADQQPSFGGGLWQCWGWREKGTWRPFPGTATAWPVLPQKPSARCGGNCGMECRSSEQDARLAARSERLRATGPIWWLSSSGALSFYHNHERSIYAIAPPPFGRSPSCGRSLARM